MESRNDDPMMMNYVTKIRAKVNIYASKKTSNLFDGSYKSIYQGNGLDFENLREYIPGDSIRDIDWKASSRSGKTLVKRYMAEKKHNIMLVWDTGRKMSAHTKDMEVKQDLALNVGGIIGYLAAKNGDNVGAIYNRRGLVQYHQLRTGTYNIERILTEYDREIFDDYEADLEKSLQYIIKNIRRRMIIFVITDAKGIRDVSEGTLKKLAGQHDVLFIRIGDADYTVGSVTEQDKINAAKSGLMFGQNNSSKEKRQAKKKTLGKDIASELELSYSMETDSYIPEFFTKNKKLQQIEHETKRKIDADNADKLLQYRIVNTQIDNDEEMVDKIVELLTSHRFANMR
ncbi:MAG: DUF58 domain-containing protein [Lachnospiraceae bacterium]|nr:DUF58 domain-containing protein [Lachnospiraceae bacterium]